MGGVTVRHIVGCAVVIAATVICFDGAAFAVATDSDKEIANAAVDQTADFPAGWKTRTLPTSSKVLDGVPGCNALAKTYKKIDRVSTARGVSDGFERDDELHGSNIRVFRDEDTAKQIYVASTLDKRRQVLSGEERQGATGFVGVFGLDQVGLDRQRSDGIDTGRRNLAVPDQGVRVR
jgi:hypothetical protein